MLMAGESLDGLSADALGGTVEFDPSALLFKPYKLVVKSVVLPVLDGRIVEHVVFVRPLVERVYKFAYSAHDFTFTLFQFKISRGAIEAESSFMP